MTDIPPLSPGTGKTTTDAPPDMDPPKTSKPSSKSGRAPGGQQQRGKAGLKATVELAVKRPGRPRKEAAESAPVIEPEQGKGEGKDRVKPKTGARGRPRRGGATVAGAGAGGFAGESEETQEVGVVSAKSRSRGRKCVEVAEVKPAVVKALQGQAEGDVRPKSRSRGRPRKEVAKVASEVVKLASDAKQGSKGGQGGREARPKGRRRIVKGAAEDAPGGAGLEPKAAPTRSRSRGGAQKQSMEAPAKANKGGKRKSGRVASSELPEAAKNATEKDECPGSTDRGEAGVTALGGDLSGAPPASADGRAATTGNAAGTVWPQQPREGRQVPSSVEAFFGRKTADPKRRRTSRMSVNQASVPLALALLPVGEAQIGAVEVGLGERVERAPSGGVEQGLAMNTSSAIVTAPKLAQDVLAVTKEDEDLGAAGELIPLLQAGAGTDCRERYAAEPAGKRKNVDFAQPLQTATSEAPGNAIPEKHIAFGGDVLFPSPGCYLRTSFLMT
jgi:hypothetical protein